MKLHVNRESNLASLMDRGCMQTLIRLSIGLFLRVTSLRERSIFQQFTEGDPDVVIGKHFSEDTCLYIHVQSMPSSSSVTVAAVTILE